MEGEEARERGAGDDGTAEHEVDERAADEGHAAEDGSADAEAPVGVLIEAQDLAGEGHAEGEQQQEDADDPGEFAGKLVGAEEEDLHHVNEHDGDHEVGAPAVHGAQKPAERDVVVEEFEAAPRVAGGGSIDQREQNAGDHLKNENHRGGAAEDIPPARGAGRDLVLGRFDGGRAQAEPLLEPVVDVDGALLQAGHELAPRFRGIGRLRFFGVCERWRGAGLNLGRAAWLGAVARLQAWASCRRDHEVA